MANPLADLPGYKLRRAAQAVIGDLADHLSGVGLRISEASVLLLVGDRQDITASEIGRTLDIQRANMVPLLKRLETANLSRRVPIDRKSFAIVLTPEGLERLAQTQVIIDRFETSLIERIPQQHRDHFMPIMDALLR